MGKIIDYCCSVYPSLVFPMFMSCIDGSGLVKLVKIRLALLPVVHTYVVKKKID